MGPIIVRLAGILHISAVRHTSCSERNTRDILEVRETSGPQPNVGFLTSCPACCMLGAVLSVLDTRRFKTPMQYLMRHNTLHLIERDIAENQI